MGTSLTEAQEKELRRRLTETYANYINDLLGDSKEFCSQQIAIPYLMYVKKGSKTVANKSSDTSAELIQFLAVTLDEFKQAVAEKGFSMEATIVPQLFASQTPEDVDAVAAFLEGCEKRFFVISVRIVPIGYNVGHQTLLVFNKERKKCIVVEPQLVLENVVGLYSQLLARLGLEYEVEKPLEQCVQAVAKDRNCMFWSLLLLTRYIKDNATSLDEVSKKILAENPTPEALKRVIDVFKHELYHTQGALPPVTVPSPGAPVLVGGKKTKLMRSKVGAIKWASSTESRSHKRTRRLRRVQKSKSRSSKSARRTRKHA